MPPRRVPTQPPVGGGLNFPRPGVALKGAMLTLLAIWVMFAVSINWADGGSNVFSALVGNTNAILQGQVWRLLTAPLVHLPSGDGAVGHIVVTLLGLYFLGPSLEAKWGPKKTLLFLYGASVFGFVTQMVAQLVLPASAGPIHQQVWFGALGAVEAIAIAWALSFKGRQVMLMFVLPVSSTVLVIFVVGISVLRLIAGGYVPEGLVSPFGAMLFGWLVGGGTPSPARKLYLRWKLKHLQHEAAHAKRPKPRRPRSGKFELIEGGKKDEKRDKKWLN